MLIFDSSSMILLAKAGLLENLVADREAVIPALIYTESVVRGKDKGREDAFRISNKIIKKARQDLNV